MAPPEDNILKGLTSAGIKAFSNINEIKTLLTTPVGKIVDTP